MILARSMSPPFQIYYCWLCMNPDRLLRIHVHYWQCASPLRNNNIVPNESLYLKSSTPLLPIRQQKYLFATLLILGKT